MAWDPLYRPMVFQTPKEAGEVGTSFVPTFFLPTTVEMARFIKGMLEYVYDKDLWSGTDEQVRNTLSIIALQIGEVLKTQGEVCGSQSWGADFRIVDHDRLEVMQGLGLPTPPWEFRTRQDEGSAVALEYRSIQEGGAWRTIGNLSG